MDLYGLCIILLTVSGIVLRSYASDVIELTDTDFDDTIKGLDVILMEFYAPWCGHCKKLAPEYELAATKLKSNDPPVPLGKVDCDAEKATCDRFGVSGFPTLKIFRRGDLSADYDGPRTADGIAKHMRGQAGHSSKELHGLAAFDKFVDSTEHSVVGFFEKDSLLKKSFQFVADSERASYRFAHTSDAETLDKHIYKDDIVIFHPRRLHNKFEENFLRYRGDADDTEAIRKFVGTEMHGLCGGRNTDNSKQFLKPLVVVYYKVDYVKDPKGTNYWRNRVLKVAKEFEGKMNFAISDRDEFTSEMTEYNVGDRKSDSAPSVAAQGANGEKYPMMDDFSVDNLRKFVSEVLEGRVESYMKSEPIPEKNDGPVKVVVAKNFEEVVMQDKDVLVEFYAPWCGHCKKLAPIYDELGAAMKDEDVVIAKMDATANDIPSPAFAVKGFPTLYWAPRGGKNAPVKYQSGRELDGFIRFIALRSSKPLKGYDKEGKKKKKPKKPQQEL